MQLSDIHVSYIKIQAISLISPCFFFFLVFAFCVIANINRNDSFSKTFCYLPEKNCLRFILLLYTEINTVYGQEEFIFKEIERKKNLKEIKKKPHWLTLSL